MLQESSPGSISETATPSDAFTPGDIEEDGSIDSEDERVYCICKKPYAEEDGLVVMIGCDK
jgi:COMPASS component SPP1